MNACEITVGISTLDRPEALRRCLTALFSGDALPGEVVVVDQGHDSRTEEVVTSCRGGIPVHYIRQPRRGLSAARNAVVQAAHGTVVAVTDDDCVPDPRWVRAVVDAFAASPSPDAVTGRVLALGPETPGTYAVSLRTSQHAQDYVGDALPWAVGTGANFAARRECLLRVGGYDERLGTGSSGHAGEDLDLNLRLLKAGARIRYEPAALVFHERQNESHRLATRWSYGHGIGAICGMRCRQRDRHGVVMLKRFLRSIAGRALRAVAARDRRALRQAGLSLAGTLSGVRYGWRAAGVGLSNASGNGSSQDGCRLAV